jgi:hypothetical protein
MAMTTKTIKTVLFASLITAMILPLSGMNFVDADTDYFSQAAKTFETIQELDAKIYEDEKQLSELSDLEKLVVQTRINENNEKLDQLWAEMDRLEKLNMVLYEVTPEVKQKLESVHESLKNKYVSSNSSDFAGENPIERIGTNLKSQSIIVMINPDELVDGLTEDSIVMDVSRDIQEIAGENIPIEIKLGKFTPLSCTAQDDECRPIISGISIDDTTNTDLNTIGFKASKTNYGTGFVIAAHTIGSINKVVHQPHDNTTATVGTSKAYCYISTDKECDMAYVQSTETVNNEIYKLSGTTYDITSKTADSSQTTGNWIYKQGARTGITFGELTENDPSEYYNVVNLWHGSGDSGAIVFDLSGGDADLFGLLFSTSLSDPDNPTTGDAYYYAYDYVETKLVVTTP